MRGKEEKDGETCELGREVADSQRGRGAREVERGEKRLRSPPHWVFCSPIKEGVHTL